MRCGLGLIAIAAWYFTAVSAARCEDQPYLMLDTGGHQAMIRAVTFTADGKYLVSAGDDKTVRVWDWQAGRTVRTIRGRVGPGIEGEIYAMALSPNDRWLAVGGVFTGLRLYDFATGELKALLTAPDRGEVVALAFSADSRWLISVVGRTSDETAIIWDMETRQPLEAPLQGHKLGPVAFTPGGAQVVSDDKTLRLGNIANGAPMKAMQGHGYTVSALAVSPADGTIASGDVSGEIRLWDGETGADLHSGSFARLGGRVGSLSFSRDGRLLLATCVHSGCHFIQKVFDVASGREIKQYSEHDNSVGASAFSPAVDPKGQLVATGGGNNDEIHIWDPRSADRKAVLKGTGRPVYAVAFSADGLQFAWGSTFEYVAHNYLGPVQMALRLPRTDEPFGEPQLVTSEEGWIGAGAQFLEGWGAHGGAFWSLHHKAGGAYGYDDATLDIVRDGILQASITRGDSDGYRHRSYGFTPDGRTVISGGMHGWLTAYRRDGRKIGAFFGHQGEILDTAVSRNGEYLVSGSTDQTVRLWDVKIPWDLKRREPLVTLFYGTDEWVMWTPEGFYTGSKKGPERVGWQINHGFDKAADYVTAEQVRNELFRPDLVAEKIAGDHDGKVAQAAAQLNIDEILKSGIAPDVSIIRTEVQEAKVTVTARIIDKGGGIGLISWRINGQPEKSGIGSAIRLDDKGVIIDSFDLAFPDNTIEVMARNKSGKVASKPASASVKVDPEAIKGTPNLYILAVGVNGYRDPKRLNYAVDDAELLSKAIAMAGKDYLRIDPKHIVVMREAQVTAKDLSAKFKELSATIRATDVFLFFIAGHGRTINSLAAGHAPEYYFVPGGVEEFSDDAIRAQGFGPKQWQEWSEEIGAQKSIWIFDTCEFGSVSQAIASRATVSEIDTAQQQMKEAVGRTLFMAASDRDVANEGYKRHGLLTYAIVEGLAKAGDGRSPMIDLLELSGYVQSKVPQYSREIKKCHDDRGQERCQKPKVLPGGNTFPVVPRCPAVLDLLNAGGPVISPIPTHVVIATADLMESATRGGSIKRQLTPGTTVTLIKTELEWAYIAKDGTALGYILQGQLAPLN